MANTKNITYDQLSLSLTKIKTYVDGKDSALNNAISSKANASHTHKTSDITSLDGYTKASAAAALSTSDSLNVALGKLEALIDTKQGTHSHPYAPAAHTSDTTVHITADERSAWNAKSNLALGTTSATAFRGDYGQTAYNHATSAHNYAGSSSSGGAART